MPVPIQILTQNKLEPVTIGTAATAREALSLMIRNDFSQLPVTDGKRPIGFVTGDSIARASMNFNLPIDKMRVRDAIVKAQTFTADEDVFDLMDDLLSTYAVLIVNQVGELIGIVTSYDTSQFFKVRAADILLVEDIESTLKNHICSVHQVSESGPNDSLNTAVSKMENTSVRLRNQCGELLAKLGTEKGMVLDNAEKKALLDQFFPYQPNVDAFESLTLGQYIDLALSELTWQHLKLIYDIEKEPLRRLLNGVRDTRNKLAHFNPNVTPEERDQLKFCASWFKNHPLPQEECESPGDPVSTVNYEVPQTFSEEDIESEVISEEVSSDNLVTPAIADKYSHLASYLQGRRKEDRLQLTFTQIEDIIKGKLPSLAREHSSWWANDPATHIHSLQWLNVNWRVVSVNMTKEMVTFAKAVDRERAYIEFFSAVQHKLSELPEDQKIPLHNANPLGINWLMLVRFPPKGEVRLILSFAQRQRLRLELYIDTGDGAKNNAIFETLKEQQSTISSRLGSRLEWEQLEKRRACRVAMYISGSIAEPTEELEAWAVHNASAFYRALEGPVRQAVSNILGLNEPDGAQDTDDLECSD